MPDDGMHHLTLTRAARALRELAQASQEALEFFEQQKFDAAQLEVDRCRRAVRTLDEIRREQHRLLREDAAASDEDEQREPLREREGEPSDDELYNGHGMEGGIAHGPESP